VDKSHAYNTVWQVRSDSWCRLEEAADRLNRPTTNGKLKEKYAGICRDLLTRLTPLEPFWAYPGSPQFAKMQRLFAAGDYDKFFNAVSRINRALTTESYRTGDVEHAGLDEQDMFPTDPRALEHSGAVKQDQLYFEVLVVESMTEAQERALRNEVRSAQRSAQLAAPRRRVRLRVGGRVQR
jgi:arginine decarboxylase